MAKKIDRSTHIGDGGVALIHRRVNEMGYVWHERGLDAGIDGEIELRDPATGEVANRILLVQSKASENRFAGESDRSFHYICRGKDIDYWMSADIPVLLICSHPSTDEAWWVHVQSWFMDPVRRASERVDFDKETQRFDATAARKLLALGDPHGRAHTPVADPIQETLTSNLLSVVVPRSIYSSPTDVRTGAEVYQAQRVTRSDVRHDFTVQGGRLYTWKPPSTLGLDGVITGPTQEIATEQQASSSNADEQRGLVWLLNAAMRQDCATDCDWHRDRKLLYFRATPDLSPRRIRSSTGRSRLVFNPKQQKKDPAKVGFCQHAALGWRFLLADGQWYCQLTPTYHYTRDGYRESLYAADLLSGIKRRDRNPAVYGQTRMWANYLRGEDNLLGERHGILAYGDLLTFSVDRGIDDAAWLADPADPQDSSKLDGEEWGLW